MNIIKDDDFTRSLATLGKKGKAPAAILVISAHWLTVNQTSVSVNPRPKTIHDFSGFPDELYDITYEPPGHPQLAHEVESAIHSVRVHADHEMGLDHGAWSILKHMYPKANIPVFQMSIDFAKPPQFHFDLARELRMFRNKGVLIIGSGNIVHNLRVLDWEDEQAVPFDWAQEFDELVKQKIERNDYTSLINYQQLGAFSRIAVPTNDHYLPMLYTLGLLGKEEHVHFTYEGFQHGGISMRCFESHGAADE